MGMAGIWPNLLPFHGETFWKVVRSRGSRGHVYSEGGHLLGVEAYLWWPEVGQAWQSMLCLVSFCSTSPR